MITIFTPTFNRAHTLPRLFRSLCAQTVKDFIWLVIDDGSTDHTKTLIADFAKTAPFQIKYIFQQNQGKHIAINRAALECKTDFLMTIDSDDYLASNAVEVCCGLSNEISFNESIAGFTFIRAGENQQYNITHYGKRKWFSDEQYDWSLTGEMMFVLKKVIVRQFPFPVYPGERFCQESVQLNWILEKYEILFTDHILAFGEYLEDGLSQNLYARLIQNPRYAMLAFTTKLQLAKTEDERKALSENYWDIVFKTRQPKIKALLQFPLLLSISVLGRKIMNRFLEAPSEKF